MPLLSRRKSAEPTWNHGKDVTEKSTSWLGRGAHGGVTEGAGKKAEDLVRGGQKGRPGEQLLARGAERLECSGPWSRARS